MTMTLEIGGSHFCRLAAELARAGAREIGGVLVGEHVAGNCFRLLDLSVQRRGGGHSHFTRDPLKAAQFVNQAILDAGGDPTRINYLGEWHSHPSFSASPSIVDVGQMQRIVEDPDEVAGFAVLIVVSGRPTGLELSATLFRPAEAPTPVELQVPGVEVRVTWHQAASDPVAYSNNERCSAYKTKKQQGRLIDGNASGQV